MPDYEIEKKLKRLTTTKNCDAEFVRILERKHLLPNLNRGLILLGSPLSIQTWLTTLCRHRNPHLVCRPVSCLSISTSVRRIRIGWHLPMNYWLSDVLLGAWHFRNKEPSSSWRPWHVLVGHPDSSNSDSEVEGHRKHSLPWINKHSILLKSSLNCLNCLVRAPSCLDQWQVLVTSLKKVVGFCWHW